MGLRGTTNLFNIDLSSISPATVSAQLEEVPAGTFQIVKSNVDCSIKEFVTTMTNKVFKTGQFYYQLTKKETIQYTKEIYILDKTTGKLYGGENSRKLLQLPPFQSDTSLRIFLRDVDVKPSAHGNFDIFVQSTSANRKILQGTSVLFFN